MIASTIRINAPLFAEFVDVVRGAVSGAMTTGSITPEASAGDVKAGAGACATFAAVGGGEATSVAALGAVGSVDATGVDSGELLGADESVGALAIATDLTNFGEDVGAAIVACRHTRVTTGRLLMAVLDRRPL
jgi:hypothetical protein